MKKIAIVLAGIFVLVCALNVKNVSAEPHHEVVQIKEQLNSWGYYPNSIYRDSSCMCGSDWPADYVFEFYVPNSYANRGKLKITTTNNTSSCYINNYVNARVYTNDIIKACVGYWSVRFCGKPNRYDVAIWY